MVKNINMQKNNLGFSIIEIIIVIAVLGVLAAIAIPSYQNHVIDTKRGIMMSELQGLASKISQQKVTQGSYRKIKVANILPSDSKFPVSEKTKLYRVSMVSLNKTGGEDSLYLADNLKTSKWKITATPIRGTIMDGDGDLSLDYNGRKCHKTKCGTGEQWKQ